MRQWFQRSRNSNCILLCNLLPTCAQLRYHVFTQLVPIPAGLSSSTNHADITCPPLLTRLLSLLSFRSDAMAPTSPDLPAHKSSKLLDSPISTLDILYSGEATASDSGMDTAFGDFSDGASDSSRTPPTKSSTRSVPRRLATLITRTKAEGGGVGKDGKLEGSDLGPSR